MSLKSLSAFILDRKNYGREAFVAINQILKNLDTFDCSANEIPNALADVLVSKHFGEANQLLLLDAIRSEWITGPKERLEEALVDLSENGTDKVKEMSRQLLGE